MYAIYFLTFVIRKQTYRKRDPEIIIKLAMILHFTTL